MANPQTAPPKDRSPEWSTAVGNCKCRNGRKSRIGAAEGLARVSEAAATAVRVAATIICVLLALHIAFVVFKANQANSIVRTINDWADWFAWRFRDMFVPKDERVRVLADYGIAAVAYLIAGRIVSGLLARIR